MCERKICNVLFLAFQKSHENIFNDYIYIYIYIYKDIDIYTESKKEKEREIEREGKLLTFSRGTIFYNLFYFFYVLFEDPIMFYVNSIAFACVVLKLKQTFRVKLFYCICDQMDLSFQYIVVGI